MNNLSLEEKMKLLTGKNTWQTEDLSGKIPSVFMADGPHGLRKTEADGSTHKNTAYPALSLLACSWNREIAFLMGESIADDCIENDVDILLAPGVNIKRNPFCGRNFEYFSEDPVVAGELAYEYIRGVQSKGIGASLKHFACNNSENYRLYENSELDDRTLYEIYLPAFQRALEANPYTVMCSYNLVNGVYASENRRLLKNILRKEFGFDGVIVSDWDAVRNRARALKATLDLEMPYNENSLQELQDAYEKGFISEEEIDECADRLLALVRRVEEAKKLRKISYTPEERHNNARKIAEEGIVLLKNDRVLPLSAGKRISLFVDWHCGCAVERIGGGGSSQVSTDFTVDFRKDLIREGFMVDSYALQHEDVYGDYSIVCVGAAMYEEEAHDREDIGIRQLELETILRLSHAGEKIIVIIFAGSAVDVSPFVDKVSAIIYAGFGGEGVCEALANIISGRVCPSGKLTETFFDGKDIPVVVNERKIGLGNFYSERHNFGYRYCDKANVLPRYAFGYGLSYAEFEYSDLEITKKTETDYEVSYTITNKSDISAKEASQVYVGDLSCTSSRPIKELKAFHKDLIPAHQAKRITVKLDEKAFAFYNPSIGGWYVENGKFKIQVGSASNNIRLEQVIDIQLPKYMQYSKTHSRKFIIYKNDIN